MNIEIHKYKSRIEMEMGLLYNFELHILIPRIFENEIDFQKDVLIHFHNIKKNRGIVSFYKYIKDFQKCVDDIITLYNIDHIICEGLGAAIKTVNSSLAKKKIIIYLHYKYN